MKSAVYFWVCGGLQEGHHSLDTPLDQVAETLEVPGFCRLHHWEVAQVVMVCTEGFALDAVAEEDKGGKEGNLHPFDHSDNPDLHSVGEEEHGQMKAPPVPRIADDASDHQSGQLPQILRALVLLTT